MAKAGDFVESEDGNFADQLGDFAEGLDTLGAGLGFSAGEIAEAHADADFMRYTVERQTNAQQFSAAFTAFKNLGRYGKGTDVMPAAFPTLVTYPAPIPAIPAANIEGRFRDKAAKAKRSAAYNVSIGQTLKIEAPELVFDPLTGKPVFKIFLDSGHPLLKWKKGRFQGVEINVNRGNGYQKLDRDFSSPFVDRFMLAAGQSAIWKYRMTYLINDEPIGQPSDEVTVTVYGDVMT